MIIDYLENSIYYESLIPQLPEIQEIVNNCQDKPCGRYETEWGYYMIQEGTTNPVESNEFESHKKYIDIQCLVSGTECMEWQNITKLDLTKAYCGEKDLQMMRGEGWQVQITEGMFYVMFPEDGHKACCHREQPWMYKKVVVKIKL